ncbi:hypothetical protein EDC01DRAFT_406271 [Geopyxis carbonaria]|nr:hypothetical protein EDC01DRAFT_406271 [Geopyxis carbonaria]
MSSDVGCFGVPAGGFPSSLGGSRIAGSDVGGGGGGGGRGGGGGAAATTRTTKSTHSRFSTKVIDARNRLKHLVKGFHVSVSISFKEKDEVPGYTPPPRTRSEMTIRIKNSSTGSCVFEITKHGDSDELLTPIEKLKTLFPYSKTLPQALVEWNRHYQNPPPHWVVNFIPRAYLRRGYFLAEEICEYFMQHPDGCAYSIEYEPIGHPWCLVGTVVPKPRKVGRKVGDMWWERSEKEAVMR